ncbi:MAG TPA: hypothetical protein VMX13_11200 [Sedimentisphaerales bacterium]|nr:hypothetical protein [Sedimentisphaerales bacterium]
MHLLYKQAVERWPSSKWAVEAQKRLARMYVQIGDYEKADAAAAKLSTVLLRTIIPSATAVDYTTAAAPSGSASSGTTPLKGTEARCFVQETNVLAPTAGWLASALERCLFQTAICSAQGGA